MEVNFEQSELDIEIPDGSIGLWIDPIGELFNLVNYIHTVNAI